MPRSPQLDHRSLEETNAAIRSFLAERRDRVLTRTEREAYERLRSQWLAAQRRRPGGEAR
ncbi:hypothetical protein ACFP1Z_25165 [Streptomyces gamaensis]|uniref:Uncharacterized protein n=1 Tax=Streptomyces gamaensis TaxID=1763542 RepID=A0ABW0Z8N4_9ACTN